MFNTNSFIIPCFRKVWSVAAMMAISINLSAAMSADQIIDKVRSTWKDKPAYRVQAVTTAQSMGINTVTKSKIQGKGKKLRMESSIVTNNSAKSEQLTISDGNTTWTHEKTLNRVFKLQTQKLPAKYRDSAQNSAGIEITEEIEFEVSETSQAGGSFYVLKSTGAVGIGKNAVAFVEYWVDPKSWTVSKVIMLGKQRVSNAESEFSTSTELSGYQLNIKLDDKLFQFKTPKDTEIVDITNDTIKQLSLQFGVAAKV